MSPQIQDNATAPIEIAAIAGEFDAGKRLDQFLADTDTTLSRSRIKILIEEGRATRAGQRIDKPGEKVRPGDRYVLGLPAPVTAWPEPQAMALVVLYEDRDLIVIDKPAGLVVHPAPGNEDGTLVNALLAHCGNSLTGIGAEKRPGIVHRLDKETSGVMVAAKTELANTALTQAFAARNLDRAYLALCWGLPNPAVGEIDGAIGRDPKERKRMAVRTDAGPGGGAREALTRYRLLAQRDAAVSLLECRLATGRTHQIRVHLSHRGHPIIGDPVYLRRVPPASRLLPTLLRGQLLDFPRQALHAHRLGFAHPRTGAMLSFQTPPPADMLALLAALDIRIPEDI